MDRVKDTINDKQDSVEMHAYAVAYYWEVALVLTELMGRLGKSDTRTEDRLHVKHITRLLYWDNNYTHCITCWRSCYRILTPYNMIIIMNTCIKHVG